MKIILSHPTGNTFFRALAKTLLNDKLLLEFDTSIATFERGLLGKIARLGLFSELNRRSYDTSLQPYTNIFPYFEFGRMLSARFKLYKLLKHESGIFCVDNVYRKHDAFVAKRIKRLKTGIEQVGIYAYEDGALQSFTQAKLKGMPCIYDLPIAYWEYGRKLLSEEVERYPNWKKTMGGGVSDSPEKLNNKVKELELADYVVCPSHFVINSLPEWVKNKKIILSPFGTPLNSLQTSNYKKEYNTSNKLKVLFVGSMSQRKGLADLFEAFKLLNNPNVELIVMGSLQEDISFYRSEYAHFRYEPGRPHHEVLELMRNCDVFCLPSIVEGRALVMQEAMSQGLPIIITPNTGGEDLVIEGETGFLVPIRSPQAIAEKIEWFAQHRDAIPTMGENARLHAAKYTWEGYGRTIVEHVETWHAASR